MSGAVNRTSTCCPARKVKGRDSSKKKLLMRGVWGTMAEIAACWQRKAPSPCKLAAASVTGGTLLAPGVAIDVIAAQLPKAGLIALGKLEPAHPFCRLPEIEMRHQEGRGTAGGGRDVARPSQ